MNIMTNEIIQHKPQGEIILYQPDETVRLEVRIEDETVWLTQAQIVDLFQSSKANISEHIKNIYDLNELEQSATVRNFRTVRKEGKRMVQRLLTYYEWSTSTAVTTVSSSLTTRSITLVPALKTWGVSGVLSCRWVSTKTSF